MGYNEKNFSYLKGTSIEEYYDELIKAEYICDDYVDVSKIILRKVTEELLRNIARKYDMECNIGINSLIKNIKYNYNINFPEEICDYINIIRENANNYRNFDIYNMNTNLLKHPIELLKIMDKILKWYLKEVEHKPLLENSNFTFKVPSTIIFKNNELNKIRRDISLRDRQINNLRMKVIELGSKAKSVIQLNNIIIAIKEERSYLESKEELLNKILQEQEDTILETKESYNERMRRFERLHKCCKEIEILISNQETKLVKAELENQDLKRMINCLYEQDDSILRKEMIIKEQLEQVRKSYKTELRFSKKYIDILNTIEFSYDERIKKELEALKINTEMKMNFEDKVFNELINDYEKNIISTKRSVEIYIEILKDKLNREIKYREFYEGFLNLSGKPLRIMYILSTNFDQGNNVVINFKDALLKSNKNKFKEYIEKNIIKLDDISDEEIKLILYYRLIRLANVPVKNFYNKKYFIETLDNIVDKSYEILKVNRISKESDSILGIIKRYYLQKILVNLKNICLSKNIIFKNTLTENIYKNIQKLDKDKIEIIYENLHIEVLSEEAIKRAIGDNVFAVISIIASCNSIQTYKLAYYCVFMICEMIEKKYLDFKENIDEISILDFLNGNFMMDLFMLEAKTRFNKFEIKREQIFLLFIMQIIIGEIGLSNEDSDLRSYEKIVKVWKSKQQTYSDIYLKKKDNQEKLEAISLNIKKLEINNEELEQMYIELSKEYKENEDSVEILLLEESKVNIYFKDEYKSLLNLKEKIEELKILIAENKKELEDQRYLSNTIKNEIMKYEKQLNIIKGLYLDLEESYWS